LTIYCGNGWYQHWLSLLDLFSFVSFTAYAKSSSRRVLAIQFTNTVPVYYPLYWGGLLRCLLITICEDINLRMMDIVKEAGTGFAFPSQTTYLARDDKMDTESVQAAEQQVANWRSEGKLPFPEFDEQQRQTLEDTIAYPPEGSVQYKADKNIRHRSAKK
jgi:hypothetical protein